LRAAGVTCCLPRAQKLQQGAALFNTIADRNYSYVDACQGHASSSRKHL
jgi:hypothetical protein